MIGCLTRSVLATQFVEPIGISSYKRVMSNVSVDLSGKPVA